MCVDETTYESLEELEGNAPFLIEPILMDLEGEGGGIRETNLSREPSGYSNGTEVGRQRQ